MAFSACLLAAGDQAAVDARLDQAKADTAKAGPASPAGVSPAWRDKQIPDWTESDAKQLLADSPWAKNVTPTIEKSAENKSSSPVRARRGGFGMGGIGFGRHGGSNGGDNASGGSTSSSSSSSKANGGPPLPDTPPVLSLRWESALPVREAELKARDVRAPAVDEDHYAIAVYGIPGKWVKNDSPKFAGRLKAQAAIKRDAKTDLKPSSVEIMMRDDGPVILYLFPRNVEITWRDHQIVFEAQVGSLKIKQPFDADDMRFHGSLEL